MRAWVRPLRHLACAAAALALLAWAVPRFGIVYVGGWSMAPALTPGDLVLYTRAPVRVGERDVVLALPGTSGAFLHRVVAVQLDGGLRTKGDANDVCDPTPVPPQDVAGVVTVVLPTGRALHAVVAAVRWCYNHVPIANTRR